MSYTIQLYRKEVKEKQQASHAHDFFENEENLIPFTTGQSQYLRERLISYGFFVEREENTTTDFGFKKDEGISALLTANALYFSSTGDGIFEIGMTASEFTDTEEFVKYDPQNGGWEEF